MKYRKFFALAALALVVLTWPFAPSGVDRAQAAVSDWTWTRFLKQSLALEKVGADSAKANYAEVDTLNFLGQLQHNGDEFVSAPPGCPQGGLCLRATAGPNHAIAAHSPILGLESNTNYVDDMAQPLTAVSGLVTNSLWSSTNDDRTQLALVLGATGTPANGGTAAVNKDFTLIQSGATLILLPGGPSNWSANSTLYVRYNGSTKLYYWSTTAPTSGYVVIAGRLLGCASSSGGTMTQCGVIYDFGKVERFFTERGDITRTLAVSAGSDVTKIPIGYYGQGDSLRITLTGRYEKITTYSGTNAQITIGGNTGYFTSVQTDNGCAAYVLCKEKGDLSVSSYTTGSQSTRHVLTFSGQTCQTFANFAGYVSGGNSLVSSYAPGAGTSIIGATCVGARSN